MHVEQIFATTIWGTEKKNALTLKLLLLGPKISKSP